MSKTKKCFPIRSSRGRSFPAFLSLVVLVPAIGLATFLNSSPMSVAEDRFEFASQNGTISVRSIQQMSVGISTSSGVIVTDPTGAASRYADIRPPDLILISHEHGEHYDPGALEDLAGPGTRIVVPPYVMERLPGALRDKAIALADGESAEVGQITVEAVAAYGLVGPAAQWHPRGRGNSYLVTVEDRKVLVAGSTEAVPEMLALRDIDLAVLPLYPPYALGPQDAARAVSTMQPAAVYIYQYNSPRTRDAFVDLVRDAAPNVRLIAPDIPSQATISPGTLRLPRSAARGSSGGPCRWMRSPQSVQREQDPLRLISCCRFGSPKHPANPQRRIFRIRGPRPNSARPAILGSAGPCRDAACCAPARHSTEMERKLMKVLIVLTSHDTLGDTGRKTGFWLEELAAPHYVFKDAGVDITLASPKGGQAPLDPVSNDPAYQTDTTRRFEADAEAMGALASTVKLADISADDFDTVFYPGGHGPMWDLAEDRTSVALIEAFWQADKPVGFVCHGPAALRHATKVDGSPLVEGLALTSWTDSEEDAVGLTDVVPFLLETELRNLGGQFERTEDWGVHIVTDGLLTTGQNPASSAATASRLLEQFAKVDG